ncbi:unnamed protein product [Brassicogethes aeneus]|uniref:Exonuclease domain-containing protein n=1 Tax=Brassicogethes aeneus TaxID=1431903 RepID=A0A9P0BDM1_BRAAE|nr:unnamed protein product [Brassicogethes aeneus]
MERIISPSQFYNRLLKYLLSEEDMYYLGYPVQSPSEGFVIINKETNKHQNRTRNNLNVDAREFKPLEVYLTNNRTCSRCSKPFLTNQEGYITKDKCTYHWGKLERKSRLYGCCYKLAGSAGCTEASVHVWSGTEPGRNGPYFDYVRTNRQDMSYGVYAMDCEMCYTVAGLEATKVTLVNMRGHLVYDSYILPANKIVDYNTRWSGITPEKLKGAKRLQDVQRELLEIIHKNTILIGHGLENDLRALKLLHSYIIDTSDCFPPEVGPPRKLSLKALVSLYLNKQIQYGRGEMGHDSFEDALACVELMLWKVNHDFRKHLPSLGDIQYYVPYNHLIVFLNETIF